MSFFKKIKEKISRQTDQVTQKFKEGLEKSRDSLNHKLNDLFARFRHVDEEFFEELEEILIGSDVGVHTVLTLIDELKMEVKRRNIEETSLVREIIVEKLVDIYNVAGENDESLSINQDGMTIILFVGVNGVGKTTTIGKVAHKFIKEGKKVMLAAGDTFRAGAIEQLEVWGQRVGAQVVRQDSGSDPAAVVFDAIKAAKENNADILLCDTAGRLQNKVNLMNELAKIKRVIEREVPGAPHEVLLVIDATTGQNGLTQAKVFKEVTDVSGIVLTKLDGTAKGGIVLAIRNELRVPVKFVGLGEKMEDLQPFDTSQFVYGLFSSIWDNGEEKDNK